MSEIVAPAKTAAPAGPWTRQNPFPGKLAVNRRLSSDDSAKDTRHFEIDLTGWGLSFEPGDSVAVYPTNDPNLVNEILRALGAKGDEPVLAAKTMKPFREALLRDYSITQPTPKFLKAIAQRASAAPMLTELLHSDRKHDLENYLWGSEVIDFLLEHPSVKFTPEEFVGLLTKLQPRLYSVASSLRVFPNQVHLIVDVVQYESRGRVRKDWTRYRDRAVPRVFAGATSNRRKRKKLALLWSATREVRLCLQRRLGTFHPRRPFDATRLRVVARSSA